MYSQTCANGLLQIAVSCPQRPI